MAKIKNPTENSNKGFYIVIAILAIIIITVAAFFITTKTEEKNNIAMPEGMEVELVEGTDKGTYIEFSKPNSTGKVIDDYSDPQCSYCKMYKESNGDAIFKAIEDGHKFRYHPMTFLDREDTGYSHKNAEALIHLVQQNEVEAAWNLYNKTWTTYDQSNEAMAANATNATEESVEFIRNISDTSRAIDAGKSNYDYLEANGGASTPTIFVDGTLLQNPVESDEELINALNS